MKTTRKLSTDFELNLDNWQCKTIPKYLEAIKNYAIDIQDYYENKIKI